MNKNTDNLQKKLLTDISETVNKLVSDDTGTLNLKITSSVLKDLRYSFKIFRQFHDRQKITMFGSARTPKTDRIYKTAYNFAKKATANKFMIITGGGPGIMAAGNSGADKASFGLSIRLPFEQQPNEFIHQSDMMINYKYFFIRKLFLVKEADACVFFPGGFGTLDEIYEVITLIQTGKAKIIPLIFFDTPDKKFWKPLLTGVHGIMEKYKYISEDDKHLYYHTSSITDALNHIKLFYRNFHSVRFYKKELLVRIKKAPTLAQLKHINKKFGYLAADGVWTLATSQEHESNEPEITELPRLRCRFERKDFGGLRLLINELNLL